MRRDDRVRILHMIQACEDAAQFVVGREQQDLDKDKMLLFALVRAVEIVGEAASKVSPETRELFSFVPWPQILAMRNRLVHAYFDINKTILWRTVAEDLPSLLSQLRALVPDNQD